MENIAEISRIETSLNFKFSISKPTHICRFNFENGGISQYPPSDLEVPPVVPWLPQPMGKRPHAYGFQKRNDQHIASAIGASPSFALEFSF